MARLITRLLSLATEKATTVSVCLIMVVVLAGVIYSLHLGEGFQWPDERQYYALAANLLSKHEYTLNGEQATAFRPPGYPFILALGLFLGAGIVHLRILNFIAFGLCIYILNCILRKQSSALAGVVGVILVVCYPILFYTSGTLLPVMVASLIFLLVLFILCRDTFSNFGSLLSGLLTGYLVLTIPSFIFPFLVIAFWIWFSKNPGRIRTITTFVITALSVVSLWSLRNYMVFKSFVFVSSNSGLNLLLGNSENATPSTGPYADITKYEVVASQLNEVETDHYYRSEAFRFIRDNKVQALRLYFLKVAHYFNYTDHSESKSKASSLQNAVMLVTYAPLFLLFLVRLGMLRLYRPTRFEILLVLLYISNAFFTAIFFPRIRFRLPFDFLLIIIVAGFLENIYRARIVKPGAMQKSSFQNDERSLNNRG